MERVHRTSDPISAQLLKSELEAHGIEAWVEGEHLAPLLGGAIPAAGRQFQVCIVHDHEGPRARRLVEAWRARRETPADAPPWRCPHCGEENEPQFEICWQCETERPLPDPA